MRHIDLRQLRRFAKRELFEQLEIARQELAAQKDHEQRRRYIDKNSSSWSTFVAALWMIGYGKCWYSEVILEANSGEVEHFRPKKQVWKSVPPHVGYWWHAFDWHNFRLAHPLVNKRRKDYSTGREAGKGCYFPLRDERCRATGPGEEQQEEPVLLDPTIPRDCRLICFDTSSGRPIPRFKETDDHDGWRYGRAKASIEFYHLDEGTWNAKREDLMHEVGILCNKVLEAAARDDWSTYEKLVDEMMSYIHPFAEFSSAAMQVLREKGMFDHVVPAPAFAQRTYGANTSNRLGL